MTEKQRERYFPRQDSYKEMLQLSQNYNEKTQKFKKGDFVFLDLPRKAFQKSTGTEKRGMIYIIDSIVINRTIKRYYLVDLNFKKLPGIFYEKNLRQVPEQIHPTKPSAYS